MCKYLLILIYLILTIKPVYSQKIIDLGNLGTKEAEINIKRKPKPLAKDIKILKKTVIEELPLNENFARFSILIGSEYDTYIKLRFNDPNIGLPNYKPDKVYNLDKHIPLSINFVSYGVTHGNIDILDERDNYLVSIPYKIINQSKFRKNLSIGTSTSLDDLSPNIRSSFSLRRKKIHDGENTWGLSVSGSSKIDDFNKVNLNVNFNYSW